MATVNWKEQVKGAFTENLNLKFIAFILALFFFSLFHGSQDAQRSMLLDLVVIMPRETDNRVLVSTLPTKVRITLRGSRTALDELRADDIGNLQVDIHTGQERRVTFEPKMVHVPPSVQVDQFDPRALDLIWEDQVTHDVPIQVSVVNTPAPGFVVKGVPVADPPTVRVRGAKSDVLVLQHIRAAAFDVQGLTEGSYSRHLALDRPTLDKPTGQKIITDPATQSVLITTEITREVVERPFVKMAVAVTGQPKAKTQPAEVDVRLLCPPEILRALRPEQVVPRVSVRSGAPNGSESLPVEVGVDGCESHVTPSTVIVRW